MLTPEELQARVGLITSSIVPVICDVDTRIGKYTVQAMVQGDFQRAGKDALAKLFERGNELEPIALQVGARALGCTPTKAGFVKHSNGWSGDTSDAVFLDGHGRMKFIGEAKTLSGDAAEAWGQPETDQVPPMVRLQCYWHLYHWPQAETCVVPVLVGGQYKFQFDNYYVYRDEAAIKETVERCHEWYQKYIVEGAFIPPLGNDMEAVEARHPRDLFDSRVPDPEFDRLVRDRLDRPALGLGGGRPHRRTHGVRLPPGKAPRAAP